MSEQNSEPCAQAGAQAQLLSIECVEKKLQTGAVHAKTTIVTFGNESRTV
jgi:hypothetical protein